MRRLPSGTSLVRIRTLLAVVLVLLTSAPALAQSQASTGQIAGAIVDSSGDAVKGAAVKVSNSDTGFERTVDTNEDGLFTHVLLPSGNYEVTVDATGFSKSVAKIQVVVGRTTDVNLTLTAGGVTEEVTVTASSVAVQTTRSEPDAVLNERAIENLPINGRRFQDFVTLTPTAQVEPSRSQISLAGQRGINGNINVDGADYNNPFFGGIRGGERSNFIPTVPQESVREFQVVAAGYSAEFGRSTGGLVNVVTKSGSNDFHGTAFYLLRHKEFSRGNEFFDDLAEGNPETDRDDRTFQLVPTQQQWGGSIGGPVVEDKFFFFGAYEQQRVRLPRTVIFDQLTSFVPTPNTQEAYDFYRGLEGPFTATNDALVVSARADWQVNDANRVAIRYNFSNGTAENFTNTGASLLPTTNRAVSNDGTEKDRTNTVVGQVTTFVNSSLINELRTQYSRELRPRLSNSEEPNVQATFGQYGTLNFLPTTQSDWRLQIAESMSLTKGNHSAKFGLEYNHVFADQTFGFNQFGVYQVTGISDLATALDVLSAGGANPNRFDNSSARYLRQIGNLQADMSSDEIAVFAQDAWRIWPNFTLNAGLRWEGQYNPNPEANNTTVLGDVLEGKYPIGRAGVDASQIPDSLNQWGPRLGFAWDPWSDGKTVVRAFSGIFHARTPLLIFAGPINNFRLPPGDVSVTLPFPVPAGNPNNTLYEQFRLIGIDLNQATLGTLPNVTPEQITQIAQALGFTPNPFNQANVTLVAPEFENPRSYQAGAGIEREILRGLTVGADFTYVKTVHLQRNRDINFPAPIADPGNNPAGAPVYLVTGQVRPVTTLRQIQLRESSAKSLYRALTVSSKFERSWGQVSAFYTFSKNLSDDDNERDSGGVSYVDLFDLKPEYGYSNLDRRHQFVANPLFFLPWDIDVSSAIRLRSGFPINATLGFDVNRDGVFNDRPYSAPGVQFERNAFRNRSISTVDLRVQKRIEFGEDQKLTFSVEFFNLFNAMNIEYRGTAVAQYCKSPVTVDQTNCGFGPPTNVNFLQIREQNPDAPTFGRLITSNAVGAPFQAQVGIRYQF
jgi:hypothetical protein